MTTHRLARLGPYFGVLLFAIALMIVHHELKTYHVHDILEGIGNIPPHRFSGAVVLTLLSYIIMTGYDALALHYIEHPLSYGKVALASFVGYAFSNNIGLAMLAGGSVRFRLYGAWGLSALEITQVVAFCGVSLWLGFLALGGIIFTLAPMPIPEAFHLPFASTRFLGVIFSLIVFCYILPALMGKRHVNFRRWEFSLPTLKLIFPQIVISLLDWMIAGSVLYYLLPDSPGLTWSGFMACYLLAQVAGLASQLPGGIGVFESVMISLLSSKIPSAQVLGSLLVYRGIYYIGPLLLAALMLGARELVERLEAIKGVAQIFGEWMSAIVPQALAVSTFVGGAILLFSGVTPAVNWRMTWLNDFLPLPVMEISHFLGSLVGVGLLLLSRSIQRRVDAAYHLTLYLLGTGILFSLLKSFDYEEALALSIMLLVFIPCRGYFYRKGSLFSERFRPGWIAAIIAVLLCSAWLGLFSYKHIEYSRDLWWRFTLEGNAPRFMRALVGVLGITVIFMGAKLLKPLPPKRSASGQEDLNDVVPVVRASRKTNAYLALLGDKAFLFNQKKNSLIMYGVEGRSWIAMGDPVGPKEEWPELVWRFREMCDQYDGWTVFYEIGRDDLHLYLDLGLTMLKLGEEGRVLLENFSLEGNARKGLRYTLNKLEKDGCSFEIIPQEKVATHLPEFKAISDSWLKEKNTREKGFSLGFFDEDYLRQFPAGVVRREGKILGFTNVFMGANKEELSMDLMRYLPQAPSGTMDYLFIRLMLWGKQEGYQWFNLGMAPFSGLADHELAPRWSRFGSFVFRHGEHFYNLQGLRRYKDKFGPVWEPKYLAAPGGLALPRILANIASLISGGMKGAITK
jgi:phosphatidylglycerol lysyltransferase